jgi:hypothetical protein
MEFLAKQTPANAYRAPSVSSNNNNDSAPVNLVIQSPKSEAAGFDASKTPGFDLHSLPFRPELDFHEYRFDWLPGQISFYADNQLLRVMTEDIPDSPGHVVLNHWSNGDSGWSAGPPKEDAVFTITHAHMYFNSSWPQQRSRYRTNCPKPDMSKVCKINDDITHPLIPLPPQGTLGTTSSSNSPAQNGQGVDDATRHKIVSKGSLGFIITGAIVGLFIVLFVVAMVTVRHWAGWRNRVKRYLGFRRVESPLTPADASATSPMTAKQRRHSLPMTQARSTPKRGSAV